LRPRCVELSAGCEHLGFAAAGDVVVDTGLAVDVDNLGAGFDVDLLRFQPPADGS
jgi:hypothetical protein